VNATTFPLADPGVFRTVQGEGVLLGVPMVFVRLAGCSVACGGCDTNYAPHRTRTLAEIDAEILAVRGNAHWVWVTGGEPADHELWPLLEVARLRGKVALVTSGRKGLGAGGRLVDFLCVSPHGHPDKLVLRRGNQVNLVPGLGGTRLRDWEDFDFSGFEHKFVTPFSRSPETVAECLDWAGRHAGWRVGIQAHLHWGVA
jgi:7-carboxy-7-deazaguanine synthase